MAVTPRVVIVGAGLMGRWHADTAVKAGARVVAVVDPDTARAAKLASKHEGCRAEGEFARALELADVVHVCSPTATHAAAARLSLEAGRHALVEKPLASSAAETASLLALAEARGVLLCPVHQFLFQDGVETALAHVSAISPLTHVAFTMCSAGAEGCDEAARDRVALEILPHPLSLLGRFASERLVAAAWSVRRPAAGEIRVLGQVGTLTVSMLISMAGRPTANRMEIIGARGTIEADLFHGFAVLRDGRVSRARKIGAPFAHAAGETGAAAANLIRRASRREPAYPGLRRLFVSFYEAALASGRPPILPAETLDVAETCERLASILTASG